MNLRLKRRKAPRMTDKKDDRVDCRPHLQWVRGFDCAVMHKDPYGCDGRIRAHHVRAGAGAGMGEKPGDDRAVPLCDGHHNMGKGAVHNGARSFERKFDIDLVRLAEQLWRDSPHRRKYEAKAKRKMTDKIMGQVLPLSD